MSSLLLLICVWSLTILSIAELFFAADKLTPGQSIRDGDKLVSLFQRFELGFFSPGNSNNRYLGIWYKISPETVVWVANRNNPITDKNGVLTVSNDGNLVLLNKDTIIIWSSNSSTVLENPVARLLDSGNLVLIENTDTSSESYAWQSFDYPMDTLLSGMKLGSNLRTGFEWYLTSWRNADDPSPGDLTYRLNISAYPQLILRTGSKIVARSGLWNGYRFGGIPLIQNKIFIPKLVDNEDELYYTYNPFNSTVITCLVLDRSGIIHRYVWNEGSSEWSVLYSWPFDVCDNYEQCGVNGNCRVSKTPICGCLKGYVPKSQDEWKTPQTTECIKKLPSDCSRKEGFLKLARMKLPDIDWCNKSMNLKDCKAACTKNCSCRAYANSNLTAGGMGCLMWFKDLIDMRECPKQYTWGQDIFLRVPASELDNEKKRTVILAVSLVPGLFILGPVLFILWKKTRKRGHENSEDIEVPLVELSTILTATKNFSRENFIGVGGFGSVYKGILSTGEEIAVKRLSKNSRQGSEEFRNEATLIAKLQHKNLVALLGCCIQGEERLLIYEYMPNLSLNYFIFDVKKRELLTWPKRLEIIMGIARGLVYLHHDSKLQVIHRDLKPSNILLDKYLNPKISDFGLARIFKDNDEDAQTNRIMGTFGYMSPEYASDGTFSTKCDVFSFGVILLEIISGKRNRGFSYPAHQHNLLGHAWLLWKETMALELIDSCLEDSFVKFEVLQCIQVGLLCVQKFPEDRPDISSAVLMLANKGATLPQPKQPGFFIERTLDDAETLSKTEESHSENLVTVTTMDGR